jgi:hypothetical protein
MVNGAATDLLAAWIGRQAAPASIAWLDATRAELAAGASDRKLAFAISQAPRRVGKLDLDLTEVDFADAARARADWRPVGWTVDQAARVLLLMSALERGGATADRLRALVATADVGELIAIYRGLPLYPEQPALSGLAAEGLRTAMRPVFEAVAHRNPFPAEQFSEAAWNHMVLKALFIETTLDPIVGLDRRWNPDLARTLCDYAHERWAAGRPVSPELWRGVGRFADAAALADLARALRTGTPIEREAAALALSESTRPEAAALLSTVPALAAAIRAGRLTWSGLQPPAPA